MRQRCVPAALAALVLFLCASCGGGEGAAPARNVLLVSIDTCRADRLGCYGHAGARTPRLDRLASEGVLFEQAGTTNPVTLPAHTSMLTGTIPPLHGVSDNNQHVPAASTTLAESLRARGLRTAAFVSAFVLDSRFGLDQGFELYDDALGAGEGALWSVDQRRAGATTDAALAWLDANHAERFFLFVHYYDPHAPYDPPAPYAEEFAGRAYDGEIAYVDAAVGRLFDALERHGVADDTLVVVTADHGESLGEHGELTHMYFAYQSTMHVPLIVRAPGGRRGARVAEPVGTVDLAPTILALAGARAPTEMEGLDLSPWLLGAAERAPERVLYGESLYPTKYGGAALRSVRQGALKYVWTLEPELYDLERDPGERVNLFAQRGAEARALDGRLKALLARHREGRAAREGAAVSGESLERIRNLGYVGGEVREGFDIPAGAREPKQLLDLHLRFLDTYKLLEQGRRDQAYARCGELVEEYPWLLEAHGLMGEIAAEDERWEDAERHYGDYLARADEELRTNTAESPFRLDGGLATVHVALGKLHLAREHPDQAQASFEAALAIQDGNVEALIELARLASEVRGDFARAVDLYRRALALEPRDLYALGSLGNCLFALERLEEATDAYRAALEVEPSAADVQANLGSVLAARAMWRESLAPLRAARAQTPLNPQAHAALARSLVQVGELDEALECYGEALRLGHPSPEVPLRSALLLHDMGRSEDARQLFTNLASAGAPAIQFLTARSIELASDPDEAERRAPEALMIARVLMAASGGADARVLEALSVALAANGDFEGALREAERSLGLSGADPAAKSRLEALVELFSARRPLLRAGPP